MDLNARVYVNCGPKDGRMENRMPISHLAKAGVTKTVHLQSPPVATESAIGFCPTIIAIVRRVNCEWYTFHTKIYFP